ncbi:MAG: hypothetical protein Ct9H300mP8_10370 [Gammaproteobacteria bacterium]|nr:MAG: hypothetical protein Ct9H300mP8_10370 [Gammaproteobacteria bacterium]
MDVSCQVEKPRGAFVEGKKNGGLSDSLMHRLLMRRPTRVSEKIFKDLPSLQLRHGSLIGWATTTYILRIIKVGIFALPTPTNWLDRGASTFPGNLQLEQSYFPTEPWHLTTSYLNLIKVVRHKVKRVFLTIFVWN